MLYWSIVLLFFQSAWIPFKDIYNTFQIEVPGEVEIIEDKFITDIGEIEIISYRSELKNSDYKMITVLQEYDYPEDIISLGVNDSLSLTLLDAAVEESVAKLDGKLDYQRTISFGNSPGKIYRISFGKKMIMKSKTYIIGGTYYSLQVYIPQDFSLREDVDRFLDSFKIL